MSPTNQRAPTHPPKSEREYLQLQAELAGRALKRVGQQAALTASDQTGLAGYVDRHPFLSLGIAGLGGALLGRWLAGARASRAGEPSRPRRPGRSHLSSFYQTVVAPPLRAAFQQVIAQLSQGFADQYSQGDGQEPAPEPARPATNASSTGPAS